MPSGWRQTSDSGSAAIGATGEPQYAYDAARFTAQEAKAMGVTVNFYPVVDVNDNPDQFHVVRELRIEYLNPLLGPGSMRIDIWVEHLGNTSCVYGFVCSSSDGKIPYARGQRTIVKIDPASRRPSPWSDRFRDAHNGLRKDLPAYA